MPPSVPQPPPTPYSENRRGLETRQRVLEVTSDLIRAHGYADVTLDQISSSAA